jgi:AcrR family transcriptional regulator
MNKPKTSRKKVARAPRDHRSRVIAGARRHFLAHGFRTVTMDDLAAELGMSKKTLYAHFSSKTELLEAVLADKFARVQADLDGVVARKSSSFPERLHRLLACLREHTEEIQPAFTRDIAREAPELFEIVKTRRRQVIRRYFGDVLREGRAAGMIRSDIAEEILIEYLNGAADAIVNPQKLSELGLTARAAFGEVVTLFLEGAATEHGRFTL